VTVHSIAVIAGMLLVGALLLPLCVPAAAQQVPYVYDLTLGTSQTANAIPKNDARRRLIIHNPGTSAKIACCPTISRRTGAGFACNVGAAGSITVPAGAAFVLDGAGSQPGVPAAWNCIADTPSSPATILEYE
jgi:hypothetical protein